MSLNALQQLFTESAVWTVAAGAGLLGAAAGAVGAFAVLRRQSLQGDVVSHAALPGLAVAFLLGARAPGWLVVGGAASGWLALVLVGAVTRRSRVPADAALGGALAVFFGLGLVLLTYIQNHPADFPGAAQHPLGRYLYGEAAWLVGADLWVIGGVGAAAGLVLAAGWKELKLVTFDPGYAAAVGLPVGRLDLLLTSLAVATVAVGLRAVGVVLMTALLIAPGVAARQWSDRLGRVVTLAGLFGGLAGAGGAAAADRLGLPNGPTIVLTVTGLVVLSLLCGPARGRAWGLVRRPTGGPA